MHESVFVVDIPTIYEKNIKESTKKTFSLHMDHVYKSINAKQNNTLFNSISANGNIEIFPNNTDANEKTHNELSDLKSALSISDIQLSKTLITLEMERPDFEHGRVYLKQFGAERVKKYETFSYLNKEA